MVSFDQLKFTESDIGKTYTYTVSEIVPAPGETGMTYSTNVLTFTIGITDSGNGKLTLTHEITGGTTTFTNVYKATGEFDPDDAEAGLNPTKVLTGRVLTDDAFTFILKKGEEVLQTVTNTADGNIAFAPLAFNQDELGEHVYTITEVDGGETGMTYDPLALTFTVVVTDLGNGQLEAKLKVVPADTIFNNVYEASGEYPIIGDGEASLNPTKALAGRDLKADEFTFQLKLGETVLQTVKNQADGTIPFENLAYTEADINQTYTYTMTEVIPADADKEAGMTYDAMELTFSVKVTDAGNGELNIEVTKPADVVFNNIAKKEWTPTPETTVTVLLGSGLNNNLGDCVD